MCNANYYLGSKRFVWQESIDGIFISYNQDLISEVTKPLIDATGKPFVVGKANEIFGDSWEVTFPDENKYYFSKYNKQHIMSITLFRLNHNFMQY